MDQITEQITEDMTVGDVISKYPEVAEIFGKYGLSCIGCSVNTMEAVGVGARGHGMSDEEIKSMLKESNDFVAKKESENEQPKTEEPKPPVSNKVTLEPTAAKKVLELMKAQGKDAYLRLGVNPGGCAGYSYQLDFVDAPEHDDIVTEQHGVKLAISPKSMEMLGGTNVDYVESLQGSGFKINNPNAQSGCGCGKSFS